VTPSGTLASTASYDPYGEHIGGTRSVGKPKDGDPRACYVVLGAHGCQLEVAVVRVPYDIERAATGIEASTLPHAFADMLRRGT
jgi:diadenosine tetraphosphatase ApaH/serine/threonine PP2A family protein phosphatase